MKKEHKSTMAQLVLHKSKCGNSDGKEFSKCLFCDAPSDCHSNRDDGSQSLSFELLESAGKAPKLALPLCEFSLKFFITLNILTKIFGIVNVYSRKMF